MYFRQSTVVVVIATAIGGLSSCLHAFTTAPRVHTARNPALGAETLSSFVVEAAEAVVEMERTAQEAELLEIQALKEQAKALENEAMALEQEAAAIEEAEAALSSKVDAISLDDETTPFFAATSLEASETLEALEALEALETLESSEILDANLDDKVEEAVEPEVVANLDGKVKEAVEPKVVANLDDKVKEAVEPKVDANLDDKVEEAVEPKVVASIDTQQIRDGIKNRAARRMSLKERLGQIDANSTVGNRVAGIAKVPAVKADEEKNKVGSAQATVDDRTRKRSVSLRELVSSR